MGPDARAPRTRTGGARGGGPGVPPRRRWAAALLAVGLLAALPVLYQRARIEATYRQVALVVEWPGGSWHQILPDHGEALRELGAYALLLPAGSVEEAPVQDAVRASGFPVFLFWEDEPSPGDVRARLAQSAAAGLPVALVGGAGSWHQAADAAWQPDGAGPQVALVELEGSAFWAAAARRNPQRAVVAHWVPRADWEAYPGPRAQEARLARYLRAVRERQVRVLVVPLLPGPEGAPDAAYLSELAGRLRAQGYTLGQPAPLPPFRSGPWARFLMGVAVGSLLLLIGGALGLSRDRAQGRHRPLTRLLVSGVPAGTGLLALVPPEILSGLVEGPVSGASLVAFLASVAFPVWAVLSLRPETPGALWRPPVAGLAAATLLSVAGGVLVGGLLSSRESLLRLELFRGVKAMHLFPPLAVAAALLPAPVGAWIRWWMGGGEAPGRKDRRATRPPGTVLILTLLAAGGVAALGVYYLGRTGNELVPVPRWERDLRDGIEAVLGVRPRFKELLGHGALLAGLGVLRRPRSPGRLPPVSRDPGPLSGLVGAALLVAGSIGQVSVVNGFAHLHQPLGLTLVRVGYGWLGGLLLGGVLVTAARWALGRWERRTVRRAAGER